MLSNRLIHRIHSCTVHVPRFNVKYQKYRYIQNWARILFFCEYSCRNSKSWNWQKTRMFPIVKETPRRRITVTSSLNKISTDQLGNRARKGGGGMTPAALTPFYCCGRIHRSCMGIKASLKGTVSRDFLLLVLFMNQFPPSPRVFH